MFKSLGATTKNPAMYLPAIIGLIVFGINSSAANCANASKFAACIICSVQWWFWPTFFRSSGDLGPVMD